MLQEELVQMQADVQKRIQETERKLLEIPHFARQHKVAVAILHKVEAEQMLILLRVCAPRRWYRLYSRRTQTRLQRWSRTWISQAHRSGSSLATMRPPWAARWRGK